RRPTLFPYTTLFRSEAGMPAVVEAAVLPHLPGEITGTPFDHAAHYIRIAVDHPPAGIAAGGVQRHRVAVQIAEQTLGAQQDHRRDRKSTRLNSSHVK